MTKVKTKSVYKPHKESAIKAAVLKAWNCGEHSFDEVVAITGFTEKQVNNYLPKIGRIK